MTHYATLPASPHFTLLQWGMKAAQPIEPPAWLLQGLAKESACPFLKDILIKKDNLSGSIQISLLKLGMI